VADVADEEAVKNVAEAVSTWDVLVMNAGYFPSPTPIAKADVGDYWKGYEVCIRFNALISVPTLILSLQTNLKSLVIFVKYFFPTANPTRAAALAVISGSLVMPTKMLLGMSAYQNSKLAVIKTMEYLALENPNIFCASVHPGMVDTALFRKSGATPEVLPMDDGESFPVCVFLTRAWACCVGGF
jgi:NAD(P)-dependent dehydrogenase (short-subunit alcohol dehydrogenase family)